MEESDGFTLAELLDGLDGEEASRRRRLVLALAGALGAACGGVVGGFCGALGAVSSASFLRLRGDITAGAAVVGFVGGVCGSSLGGALGAAIGTVAKATAGPRGGGAACSAVGVATGGAVGGALGGVFGGAVGGVSGAFGGAFGGLFAVGLAGGGAGLSGRQATKEREIRETTELPVEALKKTCDKMAPGVAVRVLAEQTAKSLTSALQKSIEDSSAKTPVSLKEQQKLDENQNTKEEEQEKED